MSSFVCSKKHFQNIANGLYTFLGDTEEEKVVAWVNEFIELNTKAVNDRYNENTKTPYTIENAYLKDGSIYQLLKALRCLRYQCVDMNGYEDDIAFQQLELYIDYITYKIIDNLEEYQNAKWEIV